MRKSVVILLVLFTLLVSWGLAGLVKAVGPAETKEGGVAVRELPDRLEISVDGKPFTTYHVASTQAKPYFHPLRSPSGKIVTRGWPMVTDIPGESHDHPHHRGAWFTHGDVRTPEDTQGVDFWSEGKGKGREVHRRFERIESGPTQGHFTDHIDWVHPNGKTVLEEVRDVTIRSQPDARILDFVITLRPKDGPVTFGDTKEGSFSLRLADPLSEKGNGRIRNSEGGVSEKQTWGKRADWVDYSGALDGESLGVAIFDHPSNFRHPTYWHVRGYGLFGANPFGISDFTHDKQQDGRATLKPGEQLVFRYRMYIHSGDLTPEQIETQYKAYTAAKPDSAKGKNGKKGRS